MARLRRRKNSNVVINNQTRLFLKRAQKNCCCSDYTYHSCISIGDLSKNKAERQKIYCPSPTLYNEFEVIAELTNNESSGSGSFSTNYSLGNSVLESLYAEGCLFDAQIHIGRCSDPSDFAQFEQLIMLQGVEVTNYNLSNLFAKEASEEGVVTESVDFNFETMYSYFVPKPTLNVASILGDGPIIDSFTTCDKNCCLCPNTSGTYLVQLVQCNTDCGCSGPCIKPRILYQTENNRWRVFPLSYCDEIDCTTPVNRNVMQGGGGTSFNYVYLNGNYSSSIRTTLSNSLVSIPSSALPPNEKLISADGCDNTVILVGNTNIVIYDTATKTYEVLRNRTLPLIGINYSDVDICDDCSTAYISADNGRVIKLDLETNLAETNYINNGIGVVHHIQAISCCSFLAAVEDDLYYVCNGETTKSANILGTVTALYSVDGDIVYAATIFHGINMLWMSADGGRSFISIHESDESGNVISNISACISDPSMVNFGGYFNSNGVTEADFQTSSIPWACQTFDGVLIN